MKLKTPKNFQQKHSGPTGFTVTESNLMEHLDAKKKKKIVSKPGATDNGNIGKLFVKKSKKEDNDETDLGADIQGFEAPKPPKKFVGKRKTESENFGPSAKKMKKPDWKEVKEKHKNLKTDRKKKANEGRFDLIVQAKKIWEELRREDTPKERQQLLSIELHNIVKGHAKALVFAHDTARVVECLFATSTSQIRQELFEELKSSTLEIAKSQYSHFYLLKVMRHGTKEQRDHVINSLSGRVVELMKHKIASKIIETAYNDWANASQRSQLSQEFYGPEFKLFKDEGITTLEAAIKKYPAKKESFLKNISDAIQPIIDKGVFNHSLLHRLLSEYLTFCSENERTEMIQNLREAVVQMLHTRDGARVAMICLWHGTPKDRKAILKSFKGHIWKICQEEHGHMVLLALFDCVDDTRFVSKVILTEMTTHLKEVAFHDHGRKVILYLLARRDQTYIHPHVIEILKQGDNNAHSKKEAHLRHKELLEFVSPALLELVCSDVETWLKENSHCLLLGPILKFCVGDQLLITFKAIASVVCHELDAETKNMFNSQSESVQHWAEQSAVHMVLKKLIQFDKIRSGPPYFSQCLIDEIDVATLKGWLGCNRGAFLVVNMLETELKPVIEAVHAKLKPLSKFLQKQKNKGADILDAKLSQFIK